MSVGTTSDESVQWFDADDGPEEYVIEEPEAEVEEGRVQVLSDSESEEDKPPPESTQEGEQPVPVKPPIKRRTRLPAPLTGDELSLLGVLRKNVGKVRILGIHLNRLTSCRISVRLLCPSGSTSPSPSCSVSPRTSSTASCSTKLSLQTILSNECVSLARLPSQVMRARVCALRASRLTQCLGKHLRTRDSSLLQKRCHIIHPSWRAMPVAPDGHTTRSRRYEGPDCERHQKINLAQGKQKFWGRSLEIIPMGTTRLTIGDDVYSWYGFSSSSS